MRFFDEVVLKKLSVEDMDQLRHEIRSLDRQVLAELKGRGRICSYCGQRAGDSLQGSKYCSAWHRYLDEHRGTPPLSRVEFERKRALQRIRTLRALSEETLGLQASLRNTKIRQVLAEFRVLTGETLRKARRGRRKSGSAGA